MNALDSLQSIAWACKSKLPANTAVCLEHIKSGIRQGIKHTVYLIWKCNCQRKSDDEIHCGMKEGSVALWEVAIYTVIWRTHPSTGVVQGWVVVQISANSTVDHPQVRSTLRMTSLPPTLIPLDPFSSGSGVWMGSLSTETPLKPYLSILVFSKDRSSPHPANLLDTEKLDTKMLWRLL